MIYYFMQELKQIFYNIDNLHLEFSVKRYMLYIRENIFPANNETY